MKNWHSTFFMGLQEGVAEPVRTTSHHYLSESTIFTEKGKTEEPEKIEKFVIKNFT